MLEALIESLPICLWAINREGTFLYHDGRGLESAGIKPGQFTGSNIFELYGADNTREVRAALEGQHMHSLSEAHGACWESWMMPIRSEGGDVETVIGFTLDVSDARRAEREIREKLALIERQQQVIRDLSTPIIEIWDGVLTLPMVGVVDTLRTYEVMQSLLSRIVETSSRFAILDLTGVEVVDTKVAGHLIQLAAAVRLLGAECVITGIRPTVAQTMVALGLDLSAVVTHANLREGLKFCMRKAAAGPRIRAT
ncbi:MAG: STAS domain-containing protein [Polyangiaceae bacterium]|nr:STAS domain-containing protein [Polyangiaceae bacterium]